MLLTGIIKRIRNNTYGQLIGLPVFFLEQFMHDPAYDIVGIALPA